MRVVIRPYQGDDRDKLAQVWCLSWNATGIEPEKQPSVSYYSKRLAEEGLFWDIHVASIDNNICGFVAFDRQKSWLRQLFVLLKKQRLGVGRLLLECIKIEMSSGFWLRTDEANVAAQCVYKKNGLLAKSRAVHPVHGHSVIKYVWRSSA